MFGSSAQNTCIFASAGSGKTRTLTHLLAAKIAAGADPAGIIAFTFTEKAAEELMSRVHFLIRKNAPSADLSGMFIGTIHSWCLNYLLNQPAFLGFVGLDELHMESLVNRLYDDLRIEHFYQEPFPRGVPAFLSDVDVVFNENLAIDDIPESVRAPIREFIGMLRRNRLISFGGMIVSAVEHLQHVGPPPGLTEIYVDEYQDVNPAQVQLLHALAAAGARVTAVGDDLQCIYNWRGSDVSRILAFDSDFPPSATFRLNTNYRSLKPIIDAANIVSSGVSVRDKSRVMVADRARSTTPSVHAVTFDSEASQALGIADLIKDLIENHRVPPRDIAILLRSVIQSAPPIVQALDAANIPVDCPVLLRGGEFIELLLMPVIDWLRKPLREPRNAREMLDQEQASQQLWAAVSVWSPNLGEEDFWNSLFAWRELVDANDKKAYDIRGQLYTFLSAIGLTVTDEDDSGLVTGIAIASQIIRSVEEVHRRRLDGKERIPIRKVLAELWFALKNHRKTFGDSHLIQPRGESVVVSTVHQAKGLEWPIVILPTLAERRFPVRSRSQETSFPDAIAGRYGTSEDDERRLFYVALTRARDHLLLLDPCGDVPNDRSKFVRELVKGGTASITTSLPPASELAAYESQELTEEERALRIGLSDLLLYAECPLQYAFRRVAEIQPSVGDELGYGQSLHELIQRRYESNEPWDEDRLDEEIATNVSVPLMSADDEAQALQRIRGQLLTLEKLQLFAEKVSSEEDVEVLLTGGIVSGVIDCIQFNADDTITIRDWKSSIHDNLLPRYHRQLQFYAYALAQKGLRVRSAELVDIRGSQAGQGLQVVPVSIEAEELADTVALLESSLQGIRDGRFPASPSHQACSSCDLSRLCKHRHHE